jgi:hypothetical protein
VVFTLPAPISDIAYQNEAAIYDLLFKASAAALLTIAADPKHLGARVGITSVLHSWGSAMTHHPHVHMIVPGGGIALDGKRWVSCRPGFFLAVRVLSRLFRRLFLEKLVAAHKQLQFFSNHATLAKAQTFATYLAPLRRTEWVVYAKRSFGGPHARNHASAPKASASGARRVSNSSATVALAGSRPRCRLHSRYRDRAS